MELWWKKWPDRFEFELDELKKNNIGYELDKEFFEKGSVVLRLDHLIDGQKIRLIAKFPDLYPYFRFEVNAPDLDLPRHQNPFEKNLCLIGRATANWNPAKDYLAKFIVEQLPKVLQSASGDDEGLEEQQGEPMSEYYPYYGWMVMIDSAWVVDPNAKSGFLTVGLDNAISIRRMAALEVKDSSGKILAEASSAIKDLYRNQQFQARWVRTATPIKISDPEKLFQHLLASHRELGQFNWERNPGFSNQYVLIGVTFPEEIEYKRQGDGWIFILIYRNKEKEGKNKKWKYRYLFARAGRTGPQDVLRRIPKLGFLVNKKVGIVGLGSIGAASAVELAKCGVGELRVLDDDYVDPGTIVRWPLGHYYACIDKTDALQHFISQNYPYTKVSPWKHRLGASISKEPQTEVLAKFLDGIDLLYDATAEIGVHHLLADLARESNMPFVIASGTTGAWGGLVARFIPEKGRPCWQCFERARTEKKVALPPEDLLGSVQPVGCGSPTFTGSNFDLQEITLSGVRLAISTLSHGSDSEYPSVDWNAAILFLRGEDKPLLPQWEIIVIPSYSDCPCGKQE